MNKFRLLIPTLALIMLLGAGCTSTAGDSSENPDTTPDVATGIMQDSDQKQLQDLFMMAVQEYEQALNSSSIVVDPDLQNAIQFDLHNAEAMLIELDAVLQTNLGYFDETNPEMQEALGQAQGAVLQFETIVQELYEQE